MKDRSFYYNWGSVPLLKVSGKDSSDFLQRLSTQNFKKPFVDSNTVLHGAFLTGQGKFISLFTVWKEGDTVNFFIEPSCFEKTFNYLSQMHFSEDLKIEKEVGVVVEARGAMTLTNDVINNKVKEQNNIKTIEAFNWGIRGQYLINPEKQYESLSTAEFDCIRAQHGFPKPNIDITEDNILIEAPHLESIIDRHKGCYPGQEVIEKIYTYGRVAYKILKIQFEELEGDIHIPLSQPLDLLNQNEEKVGTLTSLFKTEIGFVGLGRVKRMHYEQDGKYFVKALGGVLISKVTPSVGKP